ncbi:MAG: beta-galactosidase [Clostridia bacterium]|nr:beta-galactosidase [Clostridia bacterium]
MKKIVSMITALSMLGSLLFSLKVFAAGSIKVEAEEYVSAASGMGVRTDTPEFSNGSILIYAKAPQKSGDCYIEYKVKSPAGGAYKVSAVTTLLSSRFTADYFIEVNGGERINAAVEAKTVKTIPSKTYPDTVLEYEFGTLELEKGENTIRIILNTDDVRSDGLLVFYMDYFELTEVPFGLKKIQPNQTLSIYEQNKPVSFDLQFNCKSKEAKQLRFEVTDFWKAEALKSNFTIKNNTREHTLYLGRFKIGWYTIEVFEGDKSLGFCSFSVVPPQGSREKFDDTPFAVDFASDWLVRGDKDNVREYIQAAKLAGIEWVRERFIWSDIERQKDSYNFEPMDKAIAPFKDSGLKIVNTFHDTPGWARKSGRNLPNDLFEIYQVQKDIARRYKDEVDVWEIWNEQDTIFCLEPADLYSSFFKAAAIGVSDAGVGAKAIVGGYASTPTEENPYTDLSLQNEIMDYSDGYNFHSHLSYTASDNVSQFKPRAERLQYSTASAYDSLNQPVWVTEAGMYMPVKTGESPSREQIMSQAKYLVTSTVQSLASGTDKHFWFILPSYVESGRELGSFYASGSPYPCYSAEAFITYILGKGRYIGELNNLPEYAEGYMFDNGKEDVAVVWSEHGDKYSALADTPVRVYDIMGNESVEYPVDGKVTLDISSYPLYIAFGNKSAGDNYYRQEYTVDKTKTHTFNTGERVVLNQKFGEEEFNAPKLDGYQLQMDSATELTVEVYNFNDKKVSGTVKPKAPAGYIITPESVDVSVPEMSKKDITFTIEFSDDAAANTTQFLTFEGVFEGEKTSPSVSRVFSYKEVETENITLFEGCDNPESWDGSNITAGADPVVITKGVAGDSVRFDLKFNGNDRWFYPFFKINDPSILKNTTGICFSVYAEEDLPKISMNFFAYLNDGRQFYLGHSKGKQVKKGWNQVTVPWSKLSLQSSPYGLLDYRPFDTDLITKISVGCNSPYDDVAPYEIAKLGYYTDEPKDKSRAEIKVVGLENGAHYKAEDLKNISIQLPKQEYKEVSVTLNKKKLDTASAADGNLLIDLSKLERGSYAVQINAKTQFNYVLRKVVNIYIE